MDHILRVLKRVADDFLDPISGDFIREDTPPRCSDITGDYWHRRGPFNRQWAGAFLGAIDTTVALDGHRNAAQRPRILLLGSPGGRSQIWKPPWRAVAWETIAGDTFEGPGP